MHEDLLQYLWRYQKFDHYNLKTLQGDRIQVISPGFLNEGVGPDFSNAKIRMDSLLWTGPIELHVNASAWYLHRHQNDVQYDGVILHVVWHNDVDVCLSSGEILPTLCLSDYVDKNLLKRHKAQFLVKKRFIPCEIGLPYFDTNKWIFWKERLYIERLEGQTYRIQKLLQQTKNNWDAVLFQLLAKGFGLNKNGAAFMDMAQRLPFGVIQKCQHQVILLEALFLGQLGLLEESKDAYHQRLKSEYDFLCAKFQIKKCHAATVTFGRLRPSNFPTLRLAQLAQLYYFQKGLFKKIMEAKNVKAVKRFLQCSPSTYWKSHYHFAVKSKTSLKKLTPSFQNLLLVNVVIPLRFAYFKYEGKTDESSVLRWAREIKAEENSVVEGFRKMRVDIETVLDSQSVLHLKKHYCDIHKCLRCVVGFDLMQKDP